MFLLLAHKQEKFYGAAKCAEICVRSFVVAAEAGKAKVFMHRAFVVSNVLQNASFISHRIKQQSRQFSFRERMFWRLRRTGTGNGMRIANSSV